MKKFLCVFLCAVFTFPIFSVNAQTSGPVITVSELTAVPGDTVAVSIDISENPGIMAMTFTVSYDTDAFTFKKYKLGIRNDYLIVDHPDKGYVSFVNGEMSDKKKNGNLFVLMFEVKENAAPGRHPFNIRNINPEKSGDSLKGCFANFAHTEITPTVINGGVTVGKICSNSGHTYGEYKVISEPNCTETGIKARTCKVCGHIENAEIPAVGHSFEDSWTVDRPATSQQQGVMSRHCKNCDAVADKVYFSLDTVKDNNIKNDEGSSVAREDWSELEKFDRDNSSVQDGKKDNSQNGGDNELNADEIVKQKNSKYASVWECLFGSTQRKGVLTELFAAFKRNIIKLTLIAAVPVVLVLL